MIDLVILFYHKGLNQYSLGDIQKIISYRNIGYMLTEMLEPVSKIEQHHWFIRLLYCVSELSRVLHRHAQTNAQRIDTDFHQSEFAQRKCDAVCEYTVHNSIIKVNKNFFASGYARLSQLT